MLKIFFFFGGSIELRCDLSDVELGKIWPDGVGDVSSGISLIKV